MKRINLPGMDIDEDEKIFLSHIEDMFRISQRDRRCIYSQFLDERSALLAEMFLDSVSCRKRMLFGGYDGAVRKMLCIYGECDAPEYEDYPMKAVLYTYRSKDKLRHSDFLGALMSLGLKRSMIGDIVPGEERTIVFVCDNAVDDALSLEKAGRVGIKASLTDSPEISREDSFDTIKTSLSSLRLDCVLAAAAGMSRDKASAFIRSEGVMLNCRRISAPDTKVSEGDVFSARGKGKFVISEIGGKTRKDRIFAELKKFR